MSRKPDLVKREAWRKRLSRYDRQALSVDEFCWREGISTASFYQWRRKLRGTTSVASVVSGGRKTAKGDLSPPSAFLPVEITGLSAAPACVEVLLPGGPRLRIPCHEPQAIRTVIAALREASDALEPTTATGARRC